MNCRRCTYLGAYDIPEEYDNTIFFYCKSLSDLKSLADYGKEDFIVTGCINFTDLRNKT